MHAAAGCHHSYVRNRLYGCGSRKHKGEAGAGIAIVSNSNHNRIWQNRIYNSSGYVRACARACVRHAACSHGVHCCLPGVFIMT